MRVLVIEDESQLARHITRALSRAGHEAGALHDGAEGLFVDQTADVEDTIADVGLLVGGWLVKVGGFVLLFGDVGLHIGDCVHLVAGWLLHIGDCVVLPGEVGIDNGERRRAAKAREQASRAGEIRSPARERHTRRAGECFPPSQDAPSAPWLAAPAASRKGGGQCFMRPSAEEEEGTSGGWWVGEP